MVTSEDQRLPRDPGERRLPVPTASDGGALTPGSGERSPRGRAGSRPPASSRTRRVGRIGIVVAGTVLAVAVVLACVAIVRAAFPQVRNGVSGTKHASGGIAAPPTAVFAHVSSHRIAIHFPASRENMLDVGFHQAYNPKAYVFVPTMRVLPIAAPATTKALLAAASSTGLFEQALRGRGSPERSAADCAVRPDSQLLSPVPGTVTLVKSYKLEGRNNDLQLEIEPDGAPLLRVVMIHIRNVTVKAGDRVTGGVTPVATVRHLTLDSSVNRYLPVSPADHTHIQVNDQRYRLPSS